MVVGKTYPAAPLIGWAEDPETVQAEVPAIL
jgi:hypothetical protein